MKLTLHDKSVLFHELAKLVKSGFGFDKSAQLLLDQAPNRAQAAFAREILRRLAAGQSIADALDQPAAGIVPLDRAVIETAERGGVLESGFSYLRDHYGAALRIRRRITARLFYPILVLHLAIFLPAIPPLILGQAAGTALRDSLLVLALFYAAGLVSWQTARALERRAGTSVPVDRWVGRIPLLGKARRFAALQRFTSVFRISLLAALRVSEGLRAAAAASGSAVLARDAQRLALHAEQGGALGDLLPQLRGLPSDLARSLASAELVGQLEQDLQSWNQLYRDGLETHSVRLTSLLPMALTALVAVFVAWRILSIYFGILQEQMRALENF